MDHRYVALLRGINVGKAKRIAMADLRALFVELGYREVETLLNSGNVVFTARGAATGMASRIQKTIADRLGVSCPVVVLAGPDLAAILDANPFRTVLSDPSRLLVAVPRKPSEMSRFEALAKKDWSPERFAIGKSAAYLWCPDGVLKGRLFEALNRDLGEDVTTRNWTTMLKLKELASPP